MPNGPENPPKSPDTSSIPEEKLSLENEPVAAKKAVPSVRSFKDLDILLSSKKGETIDPDLTRQENKVRLGEEIEKFKAHEVLTQRKAKLDEVQESYFAKMAEYQKERSVGSLIKEGFTSWKSGMPPELVEKRAEWIKNRADLYFSELETAIDRLNNRSDQREAVLARKSERGTKITKEAILARYERAVMNRTTILGMEEAEQNARREGLGNREKTMLGNALERYKKLPPGARIVGTSALIMGAGAAATAAVAGSAVLSPVALALGGFSIGARWFAESKASSNPKLSAIAKTLSSIPAVTGWLAQKGTELAHKGIGTEKKAKDTLSQNDGFTIETYSDFENVSKNRSDALTAKERIDRNARIARMAGAAAGGVAFGTALHGMQGSVHTEAPTQGTETPSGTSTPPRTLEYGPGTKNDLPPDFTREQFEHFKKTGEYPSGVASPEQAVGNPGNVAKNAAELAPAVQGESLSVGGNINNADKLLDHFRDQFKEKYPDPSKAPPAIKALMELPEGQDALTLKLGLQDAQGRSFMLHDGDSVSIENGALVIKPISGESHTLIDASGKVQSLDLAKVPHTLHLKVTPGESSPINVESPAVPAETPPAPESTVPADSVPQSQGTGGVPEQPDSALPVAPEGGSTTSSGSTPMDKWLSDYNARHGTGPEASATEPTPAVSSTPEQPVPTTSSSEGIMSLEQFNSKYSGSNSIEAEQEAAQATVNPEITAGYVWRVPGSTQEYPFSLGGTEKAASAFAKQYALSHPGSTMYYVSIKKHLFGGTSTHISAWTSNADGSIKNIARVPDETARLFNAPNAEKNLRVLPTK